MQINSFKDMYVAELQELFSMEGQIADALDRMIEVASHSSLKSALSDHQDKAQVQRQRLESILEKHGANPWAHTDQAMQMLVIETAKMLSMLNDSNLRDSGLIASVQKLEHYEIAAYGTAAALAGQLDLRDEQRMLHESLEEEKEADALLTKLAKGEVNRDFCCSSRYSSRFILGWKSRRSPRPEGVPMGAALSPFGSRRVVGGGVRRAALRLFESRSECGKEAGGLAASYDTMIKSQG